MIRVTIFNEFRHEKHNQAAIKVHPDGIHNTLKAFLEKDPEIKVNWVTLDLPECGLTDELLDDTDVLIWWGHMCHGDVPDNVAERVKRHVLSGMGFIPLHSAHASKPFMSLMGTDSVNLHWCDDQKEIVWTIMPSHRIAQGLPEHFKLEPEEMYGEPFSIPNPEEIIFLSWFSHGNVFRSGCTWKRGHGKIFYFQPGHESAPSFYDENVQKIITNAVHWAAPFKRIPPINAFMGDDWSKE